MAQQLEEREGWLDTLGDYGHMEAVGQCPDEGSNNDQVEDGKQPLFVDIMDIWAAAAPISVCFH